MNTNELIEKLNNAEIKVQKTIKTIERHEAKLEKVLSTIKTHGWNENDAWCMQDTDQHQFCYWTIVEYDGIKDDIKNAMKKLKDAERIAEDWKSKLEVQMKKDAIIETEIPEILKQCQTYLTDVWTSYDIESREQMLTFRRTMTSAEFRKMYSRSVQDRMMKTDDEFRTENVKMAEDFILDLYHRVKDITGEITSWSGIHFSGNALNGIVEGKNGTVEVDTITAGGYNIQRLHYRVLVKKMK